MTRKFLPANIFCAYLWFCAAGVSFADSVAPKAQNNSIAAEQASFTLADGFEIGLFASEKDGIANPIAMRFDSKGRLWVLCTLVYPQAVPLEPADDKLFILEDANRDGVTDKVIPFASELDMPTGFALGNGGVYIGEGTDLVFLRDTDGDDRADTREVLLSGFGTGDTHQNINSFTWSPGGELLFCQGLHNFARVETPWGIVRMDEHGIWRYRPKNGQLHAFRGCSGQNPWGVAFGPWGEPFAKGNNNELSELLPMMIHTENRHAPLNIGRTKSKSMIAEIIDSPALPDEMQGDVLIAGYFAHMIDWLDIAPDGSGHKALANPPLLTSSHRSFRPVDIQTGPDGAIYVADWFNPIIGHYQASLRHPDRDKTHGRIWRITAKGRKGTEVVDLTQLDNKALFKRLVDAPLKERERIRIELSHRERPWAEWGAEDFSSDRAAFEALCIVAWHNIVNPDLLARVFASKEPHAKAYAVRVAARWANHIDDEQSYIAQAVTHPHPRVRLEGVVAAGQLKDSQAIASATQVLTQPMDRFLSAALHQATIATKPYWWPALLRGVLTFSHPNHLNHVMRFTQGQDAAAAMRAMLESGTLDPNAAYAMAALLMSIGSPDDQRWVIDRYPRGGAIVLNLAESARLGKPKPTGDTDVLIARGLTDPDVAVSTSWIALAGMWEARTLNALIKATADRKTARPTERVAAVEAYARMMNKDALNDLKRWARHEDDFLRFPALKALTKIDLPVAVNLAQQALRSETKPASLRGILLPFMQRDGGLDALAEHFSVPEEQAEEILKILGAAGQFSAKLDAALRGKAAARAIGMPAFNQEWVNALAREVKADGNAERGERLYHAPALNCVTCHIVRKIGGKLGPELTVVGAGLPVEIIIESVLWPRRQIKEGYVASTLTTKSGEVFSGYVKQQDAEKVVIQDIATGNTRTVVKSSIAKREDAGTIMPPGLTAGLTREELRDLLRYLSELK